MTFYKVFKFRPGVGPRQIKTYSTQREADRHAASIYGGYVIASGYTEQRPRLGEILRGLVWRRRQLAGPTRHSKLNKRDLGKLAQLAVSPIPDFWIYPHKGRDGGRMSKSQLAAERRWLAGIDRLKKMGLADHYAWESSITPAGMRALKAAGYYKNKQGEWVPPNDPNPPWTRSDYMILRGADMRERSHCTWVRNPHNPDHYTYAPGGPCSADIDKMSEYDKPWRLSAACLYRGMYSHGDRLPFGSGFYRTLTEAKRAGCKLITKAQRELRSMYRAEE